MMKKEGIIVLLVAFVLLLSLSGCFKKTTIVSCDSPNVLIGERCCADTNTNLLCDDAELTANVSTAGLCGNNMCENETGESCTTCWKDCGACKKIVYIYIPRNFTLAEFNAELNVLSRDGIKFRKDITALNNVSNFFYFNKLTPIHVAEFMGKNYDIAKESRWILLNHLVVPEYYVNDSLSLIRYVNSSNWYITHTLRAPDTTAYENRILSGKAKDDYPTQPTGFQKAFRYAEWEYRNYTKNEQVIFDNVTLINDGLVEAVYASITSYNITYNTHNFTDRNQKVITTIESFDSVEEIKMTLIYSLSFTCSRNLVVTLYDYTYDTDKYSGINEENIAAQIQKNRANLAYNVDAIKEICEEKYANKIFTYI